MFKINMKGLKNIISRLKDLVHKQDFIADQLINLKYNQKRLYLEDKVLHSKEAGISKDLYCDKELIVSLTTYGRRLQDVCFTIESIMQQTLLPNKIVLNLNEKDKDNPLPIALKKQVERGLTISWVKDIRSYTKLLPTLKKYPEAIIITIDDDLLYDFDVVERLFDSYLKNPKKISALRTHSLTFDKSGKLRGYQNWLWESGGAAKCSHIFATGVGGVLYPPGSFSEEVFNEEVFTTICPTADDVWFHAMAVLNGTDVVRVESRSSKGQNYIINEEVQDMGLCQVNTGPDGENDRQIKAVYSKYGIYDLL